MATIGKLEEFNQDTEVWTQYVERLEHFFVANDIEEEKKKKIHVVGRVRGKNLRADSVPVPSR